MSQQAGRIALISTATVVTGLVGYAVYFDYMRRNNSSFRKGLKKQQKKIAAAAEARLAAEKTANTQKLRQALAVIETEAKPQTAEQQEAYFQEMVGEGERLATLGTNENINSASHFYRALRVYPNPVELLMIYQKVVPPSVFALLLELTALAGPDSSDPSMPPPPPQATVSDLDDASPAEIESPTGATSSGVGSGNEWDQLSDEGLRV
ncbi:hypothetical protein P7C73_g6684, partial [Tremellales sp. Uapishka_1]